MTGRTPSLSWEEVTQEHLTLEVGVTEAGTADHRFLDLFGRVLVVVVGAPLVLCPPREATSVRVEACG